MDAIGAERLRILEEHSTELRRGPGLTRYNGIGNVMGGLIEDPDLEGLYLRSVWFTFVGLPLFMVGIFLVSHPLDQKGRLRTDQYYFHRKVTFDGVRAAYGDGAVTKIVASSAWKFFQVILSVVAVIAVLVILGQIFGWK